MDHSSIKSKNIIEQAVLKQLNPDDKEKFRIHLQKCEECRNEFFRIKLLFSAVDSTEQHTKNEKLMVPFFVALSAAMMAFTRKRSVAILVVLVFIATTVVLELQYNLISKAGNNKTQIVSMEAFNPNQHLETIISTNLRSIDQLNIISPEKDYQYQFDKNNGISFSLHATLTSSKDNEIVMKILSNKDEDYLDDVSLYNQIVDRESNSGKTIVKLQKQMFLEKGLYYYVLQYKNEIDYIYVGRFYVK